jgi:large subunit ribosomal protein L4
MKLNVLNWKNESSGEVSLNKEIFAKDERLDIIHRVVVWQLARKRAGTHAVKGRSDVKSSTRKIYSQKGTGRARHGAKSAPQFRGGGVVFGPQVRSHEYSLNKKVRKLGLKLALSMKVKDKALIILDDAKMSAPKTAELKNSLSVLNVRSGLIIDQSVDANLKKSASNLPKIKTLEVEGLNVWDIVRHDKLLLTKEALKKIEERLA